MNTGAATSIQYTHFHIGRSKLKVMERFFYCCFSHFAFRLSLDDILCTLSTTTYSGRAAKTSRRSTKAKWQQQRKKFEMNIYFNLWLCCFRFSRTKRQRVLKNNKTYIRAAWTWAGWTWTRMWPYLCARQINFRLVRWSQYSQNSKQFIADVCAVHCLLVS